jgi:hypothetical protein
MSERMTLAEDETTEVVMPSPAAPSDGQSPVSAVIAEPVVSVGVVNPGTVSPGTASRGAVSRRALRKERQGRQRIALVCGLVIAACIGMTVLILTLARDRPAGSTPVGAGIVLAHHLSIIQNLPIPGA